MDRNERQNNRPSSGEEEDETSAPDNVESEEIDSDTETRPDATPPATDSTVMWALIFLFIAVVIGIIYGIVRPEEDLLEEQFANAKDRLKENLRT